MPWLLEFLIGVQNVPEGSACDPPDVCTSLEIGDVGQCRGLLSQQGASSCRISDQGDFPLMSTFTNTELTQQLSSKHFCSVFFAI
jgi:hypothetical protein